MVARMTLSAPRWAGSWLAPLVVLTAVLAGCASGPPGGRSSADGAEANTPSDLAGRFGNGGQTDYSSANDLLC